jgi:hypothetical protein
MDKNMQIAGAIEFAGPAVERESLVRDKNDAPKPVEASWIANLKAQAGEVSASEEAFFRELRERMAE